MIEISVNSKKHSNIIVEIDDLNYIIKDRDSMVEFIKDLITLTLNFSRLEPIGLFKVEDEVKKTLIDKW